jgi:pilus assembly protein CpaE
MTSGVESGPARSGRREILIAEDDPLNRVLLATFLEEAGYRVGVANNGLQALKLIRDGMPDLVITDVNMPEMNGLELCRRLRSHHKMARIPIIMLSGLTAPPEILAGYAEGADDYVGKPVDFAVLLAKVEALLQRNRTVEAADPSSGVVLFLHAKGGAGATTLAVNLACMLQRLTATGACVLDLSLGFGNAAHQLGLKPRLSLADLSLQPAEQMNEAMFGKFVTAVPAGPSLVRAADRPEHGELVTVPAIQTALTFLKDRFQYVVVDSPPSHNEHLLAAIDAADLVCMVSGPTRVDLATTAELVKLVARLDVPAARQLLILNLNRFGATRGEAAEVLGHRVDVTIDYSERFVESVDNGVPIGLADPDAPEVGTLAELAAGLGDRLLRAAGKSEPRSLQSQPS